MTEFNCEQRREYIRMTRNVLGDWLEVFGGDTEFYSTHYWDLLREIWYARKPVKVSEAVGFMVAIKSPYTARKYIQKLIDNGMLVECQNPDDDRSVLLSLSLEMKTKLDGFFDRTLEHLLDTAEKIKE